MRTRSALKGRTDHRHFELQKMGAFSLMSQATSPEKPPVQHLITSHVDHVSAHIHLSMCNDTLQLFGKNSNPEALTINSLGSYQL